MPPITRGDLLAGVSASSLLFGLSVREATAAAAPVTIVLAEPIHLFAFLPVYVAIDQGYYAKRGLSVSTLNATNGAHVTALISGQVWGNIGGPESDAMADNGKADPLLAICNIVNRALVYFCAKKGTAPKSPSPADMKAFFMGKKLALSRYGGTPDVLARTYLSGLGINVLSDVTVINNGNLADAPTLVRSGAADIAITSEPQISFGIEQGIWGEPIFAFPTLGDYAFSCISVRKSTTTSDPKTVQAFVDATIDALRTMQTDRAAVEATIKKDFPTLSDSIAKSALDRCYKDDLWSKNGVITPGAYERDMTSVYLSGEMTRRVPYADVMDMSFALRHK